MSASNSKEIVINNEHQGLLFYFYNSKNNVFLKINKL